MSAVAKMFCSFSFPEPATLTSTSSIWLEWLMMRSFCDAGLNVGRSWYMRARAPDTTAADCEVPLPTTNDDPIFDEAGALAATAEPDARRP